MEKKRITASCTSLNISPTLKKRLQHLSTSTKKLPGILPANILTFPKIINISKSTNITPFSNKINIRNPNRSKQKTIAYNNWELFSANKEPKNTQIFKQIHDLRRSIKNPFSYINRTAVEDDQRIVEIHLQKAFRTIHDN